MKKLIPALIAIAILLTACGPSVVENKPYELTYQDITYSGEYTGSMQDKLPNGEGTFTFDDGKNVFTYTGTWSEGKLSGNGTLTSSQFLIKYSNADRLGHFDGNTINGIPEGDGSFNATNSNGDQYCYTGNFSGGTFNGLGERRFEEEPSWTESGTFVAGVFTPTPKELLAYLGQSEDAKFGIRSLSSDFLSSHVDIFTTNSQDGLDAYIDVGYRYEAYTKSPDKYGDKLIKLAPLQILQISEFPKYNYDAITFILAKDSDYNIYYMYYIGSVDVYEGDYISAYLLPLDYFTYENISGGDTWAVACAAAYISK